jgi:hypothetical protein
MISPQEPGYVPVSCHMIRTLSVTNFRCFQQVELRDLRRVNLLVGDSGSGKTALLEALYLASGVSPELVLRVRAWRNQDTIQITQSDQRQYESLWKDLFHKFDMRNELAIGLQDSNGEPRSLRIRYKRDQDLLLPLGNGRSSSGDTGPIGTSVIASTSVGATGLRRVRNSVRAC